MPIYPIVCKNPTCGARHEVFSRVSQCHMLRCPDCNSVAEHDYAAKVPALHNMTLVGTKAESRKWEFHPNEVGEARTIADKFGSEGLGSMIQKDGRVVASSKAQMRRFDKAMNDYKKSNQEK